jgi:predicted CXXCH cytochrome family protein
MDRRRIASQLAVLAAAAAVLYACSERVVYPDRDLIGAVPSGGGGFLGYSQPSQKQTVCGSCHVGQQSQWRQTAHASAFATLNVPERQAFCEACHTVTSLGNQVTDENVGFEAVREVRFHDVQCESCHGPGLPHVRNPSNPAAVPHASIRAAIGANGTCAECHSGVHHPFVEEWQSSRHGSVQTAAAARVECRGCHEGKYALEQMGVRSDYLEEGTTELVSITCAVCHDPHGNRFSGQLRFSIDVASENENLCMRCHQKRGQPDQTTMRGPHAPEGPLLLGDAGWWPPNMPLEPGERIATTHGSQANPRLCAGCHVNRVTVEDQLTSMPITTAGHMFKATPCQDAQGRPTPDRDCPLEQRSFETCTASGCHGSQNAARSAMIVATQRITTLANQLNALLAQVPATEFDENDGRYSTAEGARFNAQLALFRGSVIHNPFLLEALLIASIQQVRQEYGL